MAVWQAFPQYPPYGGAHPDVVPHLTIAVKETADLADLQSVEQAVQAHLPVVARIARVLLIAGARADNSWRVIQELSLA